jgi:tRNA threonylcarbamoyladenosine biosynthesis protein TsaE
MIDVSSLAKLKAAANNVAVELTAGAVLVLDGDLGAGKTQFVQYLGAALGSSNAITSPTFPLVQEYEAKIPLFHFDFYRLNSAEELYGIGFYDYLNANGICLIEWGSKFAEEIPAGAHWLKFAKIGSQRTLEIVQK